MAAQAEQHRRLMGTYRERLDQLDPADPASKARTRPLLLRLRHETAHAELWQAVASDPDALPR